MADIEISIGDYVLTGGELASMVVTDSDNLLDYPVYTKPVNFRGMKVPDVLLSGHHANIKKFREDEAYKKTKERRPDLLEDGGRNE